MIRLKENICIEGFNDKLEMYNSWHKNSSIRADINNDIYVGKVSYIPEELAVECVESISLEDVSTIYRCYDDYCDYNWLSTAKQSINSACSEEFCIIYKEN